MSPLQLSKAAVKQVSSGTVHRAGLSFQEHVLEKSVISSLRKVFFGLFQAVDLKRFLSSTCLKSLINMLSFVGKLPNVLLRCLTLIGLLTISSNGQVTVAPTSGPTSGPSGLMFLGLIMVRDSTLRNSEVKC